MANDKALGMLKENLAYPKDNVHPIAKSDIELRNHYLNALSVLLKIDGEIHDLGKKYILRLIKLFGLPDNKLDEMLEFGDNPDPDIITEYIDFFKNKNEKYHLIIDCLIISKIDNGFVLSEKEFFDILSESLNIEEDEKKLIENFALIVQNSDVEKAFNLLIDNKKLFEKFKPLLLPYGIDISKYHEELKIILDFESEEWEFFMNSNKFPLGFFPSKSPVTNKQFVYFLNYINDTHLLEIAERERKIVAQNLNRLSGSGIFISALTTAYNINITPSKSETCSFIIDEEKEVYFCLSTSKVIFENGKFSCHKKDLLYPITGIDGKIAILYGEFVTKILNLEVQPISFIKNSDLSFVIPSYQKNSSSKINEYSLDEIVSMNEIFYLLNRGQSGYSSYKGDKWRYLCESGSLKTVELAISFSNNLTFRLMKNIEPKKPENKSKK
jgi:hypothetical protein